MSEIESQELFPQKRNARFSKAQNEALFSIVKDLRFGGMSMGEIRESLPEISSSRFENVTARFNLLVKKGQLQPEPYKPQLITMVFLSLYQSSQNDMPVSGSELDRIISTNENGANKEEVTANRHVLINSLRSRFTSLGIGIEEIHDSQAEADQPEQYFLHFDKNPSLSEIALQVALMEEAHLWRPYLKRTNSLSAKSWEKRRDLAIEYYGSAITLKEMKQKYGPSAERIRQQAQKGLQYLLQNCSPEVQETFPPLEVIKSKKHVLAIRGNVGRSIARLTASGQTFQEILAAGFTSGQVHTARYTLREHLVDVPYKRPKPRKDSEVEKELLETEDFQKLQKLLSSLSKNFRQKHTGGGNSLLLPLSTLATEAGLHLKFHEQRKILTEVIRSLRRSKIPAGVCKETVKSKFKKVVHRYYIILSRHQEAALTVLANNASFDKYRNTAVTQVYGEPAEKLPSTTVFTSGKRPKNAEYESLSALTNRLHLPRIGGKRSTRDVLEGCQIPIFFYNGVFCYPTSQREALAKFLKERLTN